MLAFSTSSNIFLKPEINNKEQGTRNQELGTNMEEELMKILITGADGQLGNEIKNIFVEHELYAFNREQLDITDAVSIEKTLDLINPDLIINCAAFTNVDACETEIEKAFLVNAEGPGNIALECKKRGIILVHISTDYIFDGTKDVPYNETDKPNPQSVYGKSKFAGEDAIEGIMEEYYIIRTSWLYGKVGKNFVKTMLELAKTRNELNVVEDQVGSPTYAPDLAKAIAQIIKTNKFGTYHVTNSGACTWNEFAKTIFEIKDIDMKVNPISTKQLGRPAPRPLYSVMSNEKLQDEIGIIMRDWRIALIDYLKSL